MRALWLCLLLSASSFADDCKIFPDSGGQWSVGSIRLGSSGQQVAGFRRSKHCLVSEGYSDCEYFDSGGLAYLVEGNAVVRVEARRTSVSGPRVFPWGLELGDGLSRALSKLSRPANGSPALFIVPRDNGGAVISTGSCIEDPSGERFEFYLQFDAKLKLMLVGTRIQTGSD